MQMNRLKEAWQVWICPCLLLQVYAAVLVLFFVAIDAEIESEGDALYFLEHMLTFATGAGMFTVWYLVMDRHERVKQVKVRRPIRCVYIFLVAIYALYTILIVDELVRKNGSSI